MKINVTRIVSSDEATMSIVSVDGAFLCFGLEDEHRADKVAGETRIPAGTYSVTLRKVGGFHEKYAQRFPEDHEGMLWVRGVPGFEYILIHMGNREADTAGCLLVGMGGHVDGELYITSSRSAYKKLYRTVVQSAKIEDLQIEFIDLDH